MEPDPIAASGKRILELSRFDPDASTQKSQRRPDAFGPSFLSRLNPSPPKRHDLKS